MDMQQLNMQNQQLRLLVAAMVHMNGGKVIVPVDVLEQLQEGTLLVRHDMATDSFEVEVE